VAAFERVALPGLTVTPPIRLVVIDEIGKMECFSQAFRKAVVRVLDADTAVLATIALRGNRFIEELKSRDDVEVIEITPANRDHLAEQLATKLRARCHAEQH
jgi:nucleoside-triphosphatase